MEWPCGDYLLTTDRDRFELDVIHNYLANESYWAQGIARATLERCIRNSFCIGALRGADQVGFARVVTDYATFGHVMDVFVLPAHRRRGLSKAMMERIVTHPELQGFRLWTLGTADAHGLYSRFGFARLLHPEHCMERRPIHPTDRT